MACVMHQLQSFITAAEYLDCQKKDPSSWWDNHCTNQSFRQPGFWHMITKEPLWTLSGENPSSAQDEILLGHRFASEQSIAISTAAALSPSLIWACSKNKDLSGGGRLHSELQRRGLDEKIYSDALITMYAKCGEIQKAEALLDTHSSTSIIPWNAFIASLAREGHSQNALKCFARMQQDGIAPNSATYACILKACGMMKAIERGKQIHIEISRQGLLESSVVLGGALVDMYAKCGALLEAQSVLQKLPFRNVITWNALILGYAQKGQGQQALYCFEHMQREGILPNSVTYVCILKACAVSGAVKKGKQIHNEISRQGLLEQSIVLGGALVDMYAKCGALPLAQSVLDNLPSRNVVCWSALIAGYTQKELGQEALKCFLQMQQEGIPPDPVTYLCILKACAMVKAIDKGKEIHDEISRQGLLEYDIALGNALVDMYGKCGALPQAQNALEKLPFRDVVCWSSLIAGYAQYGKGQQALECFKQMQQEGISPDTVTYVCILNACAAISAIDKGKHIHNEILRLGLLEKSIVLGGALVDMYAKCGALSSAQSVLEKLPSQDAVLWNTLIAGYSQEGGGDQALKCLKVMQHKGIRPDAVTYLSILKACASIGAIDMGKQIHQDILALGLLEHDVVLGNALVDMYAKCGALFQARSVLENLPSRNNVTWNALIVGYAQEGQGEQALECFEQMQGEGLLPDLVTFRCLLSLCGHLGLVEKGQELFDSMGVLYGLEPDVECFACMVDLLGRAGHLVKAVEVIQEMPSLANLDVWLCLLSACKKWVDVNVGAWAFEQALDLDKSDGAAYILMANIFAAAGMPENAREIEAMRVKNKALTQPECNSWTSPNNKAHDYGSVISS